MPPPEFAAAAADTASTVAPFVVLAIIGGAAAVVIALRALRRRRADTADLRTSPPAADAPAVLWGLHVPGTPVQRMAKSVAIGFVAIDPEETSQLVRSTDGGANWYVVPRERWQDGD